MGVFQTVYDNIARLAGDAWGFMVGLLIIVAMLGGLYYTLQGGAGMAFGGSKMAGMAIIGIVSLVVLVLVARVAVRAVRLPLLLRARLAPSRVDVLRRRFGVEFAG